MDEEAEMELCERKHHEPCIISETSETETFKDEPGMNSHVFSGSTTIYRTRIKARDMKRAIQYYEALFPEREITDKESMFEIEGMISDGTSRHVSSSYVP